MANPDSMRVSVVYALPDRQLVVTVDLEQGATVAEAIAKSALAQRLPEIDLTQAEVGVFGRLVSHDARLQDGDQVEIYRQLTRDPKQARRELARQGRSMGRQRN